MLLSVAAFWFVLVVFILVSSCVSPAARTITSLPPMAPRFVPHGPIGSFGRSCGRHAPPGSFPDLQRRVRAVGPRLSPCLHSLLIYVGICAPWVQEYRWGSKQSVQDRK